VLAFIDNSTQSALTIIHRIARSANKNPKLYPSRRPKTERSVLKPNRKARGTAIRALIGKLIKAV